MSEIQSDALIETLQNDYRAADIDPADRQMLDYAAKLTNHPSQITANDVDTLRKAGFGDRAIHDVCVITSYFAFVNRIADGLGVVTENGASSASLGCQ